MIRAIERTLELDASPDAVWWALTDPKEIAAWFSDAAHFEPIDPNGDPEEGAEGWFEWKSHGRFAMRVEEVDRPSRVAWRWAREAGKPLDEGPSTLVEWTLTPRPDGGTLLDLRESGFAREEDREQNVAGWQHELGELEEYLAA